MKTFNTYNGRFNGNGRQTTSQSFTSYQPMSKSSIADSEKLWSYQMKEK